MWWLVTTAAIGLFVHALFGGKSKSTNTVGWSYTALKKCVEGERLPCMVMNIDHARANLQSMVQCCAARGKKLRIATKSIRVPALIDILCQENSELISGVMCYSWDEARFYCDRGHQSVLVAYPSLQDVDYELMWQLRAEGKQVYAMVDCSDHVQSLASWWGVRSKTASATKDIHALVCIDCDMSFRPLGLHLGAHRSPCRDMEALNRLLDTIEASECIELKGVMGYEAQIAGLPDANPATKFMNPFLRLFKFISRSDVRRKRRQIIDRVTSRGHQLDFFNGGGSSCIADACDDSSITEIGAGSGILQSQIFDYYKANENIPAFCFALQYSRRPEKGVICCQSGGFIASGPVSVDKIPTPFLPSPMEHFADEGFGEVQTPLQVPQSIANSLTIGDPIFFRPAKAGEIAERFNEYLVVSEVGGRLQVVDRMKTTRGFGCCHF